MAVGARGPLLASQLQAEARVCVFAPEFRAEARQLLRATCFTRRRAEARGGAEGCKGNGSRLTRSARRFYREDAERGAAISPPDAQRL